jgi:hypothetical protein
LYLSGRDIVHVAPDPSFARFDRADQWMLGLVEVLGGVFVLGGIAASDVTALDAQAQVYPRIAGLDAFFADVRRGMKHSDLIEMRTVRFRGHEFLLGETLLFVMLGCGFRGWIHDYLRSYEARECANPVVCQVIG